MYIKQLFLLTVLASNLRLQLEFIDLKIKANEAVSILCNEQRNFLNPYYKRKAFNIHRLVHCRVNLLFDELNSIVSKQIKILPKFVYEFVSLYFYNFKSI